MNSDGVARHLALMTLVASACLPRLGIPENTRISCASDGDCPEGSICVTDIGRCVRPETSVGAPAPLEDVAIEPRSAGVGQHVALTFVAGEPLTKAPAVRLGPDRFFTLEARDDETRRFVYGYTTLGDETEGEVVVTADIVDDFNRHATVPLDSVLLDFTPPTVALMPVTLESLKLSFSEPVDLETIFDTARYVLSPAGLVTLVSVSPDRQVLTLVCRDLIPGSPHTLRLDGVADDHGNVIGPPHNDLAFTAAQAGGFVAPLQPLAPPNGGRAFGYETTLIWAPQDGAGSYTVEVALDTDADDASDFQDRALPGSPFTVAAPATQLALTLSSPVTHVWRVRADTSTPGTYGIARFEAMDDKLYVYCPSSASTCVDDATSAGNRTKPFRQIGQAIATAASFGMKQVDVAARGGSAAYEETVLVGDGFSLLGGYNSDFSVRDPAAHPTTVYASQLSSPAVFVVNSAKTEPTLIDGFVVSDPLGSTYIAGDRFACVSVIDSNDKLTVQNMVLGTCRTAIEVDTSGPTLVTAPLFQHVVATTLPGDGRSAGVRVSNGAARLNDVQLTMTFSGHHEMSGVEVSFGALALTASTISVTTGQCWGNWWPIGIDLDASTLEMTGGSVSSACTAADDSVYALRALGSSATLTNASLDNGPSRFGRVIHTEATDVNLIGGSVHAGLSMTTGGTCTSLLVYHNGGDFSASGTTLTSDGDTGSCNTIGSCTGLQLSGYDGTGTLQGLTVQVGTCSGSAVGASLLAGNYTLTRNEITAAAGTSSIGIDMLNASARIDGNRVIAGDASGSDMESAGVRIGSGSGGDGMVLVNNLIQSGDSTLGNAHGIWLNNAPSGIPSFLIVNNTVSAGSSVSTGRSSALDLHVQTAAIIANNILFTTGGTQRYCIHEFSPSGSPASLQSNVVIDCPTALYADAVLSMGDCDETHLCRMLEDDLNNPDLTTGAGRTAAGNIKLLDVDALKADATMHLTVNTPPLIATGGLNTGEDLCGPTATGSCGAITVDGDGDDRSCPTEGTDCYSRGAYEYP